MVLRSHLAVAGHPKLAADVFWGNWGKRKNELVRDANSFWVLGTWNVLLGAQTPKTELVHVTNASLRLVSWQNVAGEWITQKQISARR